MLSMPTGKQNSYANRTLPDAVLIAIRADQPVNFVGAFESPVRMGADGGFVLNSERAFEQYVGDSYSSFVTKPDAAYVIGNFDASLGEKLSFVELQTRLCEKLAALLA